MELDIIISGGTTLTLSGHREIIENSEIGIKNGKIIFAQMKDDLTAYRAKKVLDASGCMIIPGLVNTHTHTPMVYFRGLSDDLPLMDWLNNYIFPAEARFVNADMVYHSSLLAIAEMILSGTTTFCDAYFFESGVARTAIDSGIRAIVANGFTDFPSPEIPDPAKNEDVARSFIEKWTGISPLVSPALFCHAPYTCSPKTLRKIKEVARNAGVFFLTHVAETKNEVQEIKSHYGKTPVRHLHHLGVLDEKTIAVHCNWVDQEEIEILSDCSVGVSHNPESSMKLAAGTAPVPAMLEKGVAVGLGTDGCASNNDHDLFTEMDSAAKVHKIMKMDPTVMDAKTVLEMATLNGAKALGLDNKIGSIEPGKCADIIILDMNKPHLTPMYNPYSHLVYAAKGSDVIHSIINGRLVMENRKLLTLDPDKIMARANTASIEIRKWLSERELIRRCTPHNNRG